MRPLRTVLREALEHARSLSYPDSDGDFADTLQLLLREDVSVSFTHGDVTAATLELREGTRPNVYPRSIHGIWADIPKDKPTHVVVSRDTTRPSVGGEPAPYGALLEALTDALSPVRGFQAHYSLRDLQSGALTEDRMAELAAEQLGELRMMQAMTTTPNRNVLSAMEPGVLYRLSDLAAKLGYDDETIDLLEARLDSAEGFGTVVREERATRTGSLELWRLP